MAVTESPVETTLQAILARRSGSAGPLPTDLPLADLPLTSVDMVELIFEIEEAFDITVPYNANLAGADVAGQKMTVIGLVQLVTDLTAVRA
ncbi:MAG: phosphopantetheine-binding protein [Paracoccaceae bacterium]